MPNNSINSDTAICDCRVGYAGCYKERINNTISPKIKPMNNYNLEREKKESEQESLRYFLKAYDGVTGESLAVVLISERPDFICERANGKRVGIELTKVRRGHPNDILWDKLVEKQDYMSLDHALEMIQETAAEKEKKRREQDWTLPESAILVVELTDIPLFEIRNCITPVFLPDLYDTGFIEIWLADFTGLEAYDNVELFCVRPEGWVGYHPRGFQKPYG